MLHVSILANNFHTMQLLIDAGADLYVTNKVLIYLSLVFLRFFHYTLKYIQIGVTALKLLLKNNDSLRPKWIPLVTDFKYRFKVVIHAVCYVHFVYFVLDFRVEIPCFICAVHPVKLSFFMRKSMQLL